MKKMWLSVIGVTGVIGIVAVATPLFLIHNEEHTTDSSNQPLDVNLIINHDWKFDEMFTKSRGSLKSINSTIKKILIEKYGNVALDYSAKILLGEVENDNLDDAINVNDISDGKVFFVSNFTIVITWNEKQYVVAINSNINIFNIDGLKINSFVTDSGKRPNDDGELSNYYRYLANVISDTFSDQDNLKLLQNYLEVNNKISKDVVIENNPFVDNLQFATEFIQENLIYEKYYGLMNMLPQDCLLSDLAIWPNEKSNELTPFNTFNKFANSFTIDVEFGFSISTGNENSSNTDIGKMDWKILGHNNFYDRVKDSSNDDDVKERLESEDYCKINYDMTTTIGEVKPQIINAFIGNLQYNHGAYILKPTDFDVDLANTYDPSNDNYKVYSDDLTIGELGTSDHFDDGNVRPYLVFVIRNINRDFISIDDWEGSDSFHVLFDTEGVKE